MSTTLRAIEIADACISDAESLVEATIHFAEGDEETRRRYRPCAITMLYIVLDKLKEANGRLAAIGAFRNKPET